MNFGKVITRTQPSADPTTKAEAAVLKLSEKTGLGVETTPKHCFVFASNTFASLFCDPPAIIYLVIVVVVVLRKTSDKYV